MLRHPVLFRGEGNNIKLVGKQNSISALHLDHNTQRATN